MKGGGNHGSFYGRVSFHIGGDERTDCGRHRRAEHIRSMQGADILE